MAKKICEICGEEFEGHTRQRQCMKCLTEGLNRRVIGAVCVVCGKRYIRHRSAQKYCSPECRKAAEKEQAEARRENAIRSGKVARQMAKIRRKSQIDQKVAEAATEGISYGELQARRYLANIPPIDTRGKK